MRTTRLLLILLTLVLPACVHTNATMLGTSRPRMPLSPEAVAIYRTAAQVPGHYEELALLYSKGPASLTNEPTMFESMKQKAASLGANAIILDAISEPSAGAKIAGAFLGYETERQGNAIAIYVYPAGFAPSPGQSPSAGVAVIPSAPVPTPTHTFTQSLPSSSSPASHTVAPPTPQRYTSPQWTTQNEVPTADVQLRNAEREFRAGRMGLEEFRAIKKVLQGE